MRNFAALFALPFFSTHFTNASSNDKHLHNPGIDFISSLTKVKSSRSNPANSEKQQLKIRYGRVHEKKKKLSRELDLFGSNQEATLLLPSQDSYVRGGNFTDKNYGSEDVLLVKTEEDPSFNRKAVIKFDLESLSFPPDAEISATLRLHPRKVMKDESRTIHISRLQRNDWQENSVTWGNLDTNVGQASSISMEIKRGDENSWTEVDVSNLINESDENFLTLVLSIPGKGAKFSTVKFDSRESSFAPELVILPVTNGPAINPIQPTGDRVGDTVSKCVDSPKRWYDADGPLFNCKWYAQNNCPNDGESFRNFGATAQDACCACGGGELAEISCVDPSYVFMDVEKTWDEHEHTAKREECHLASVHNREELDALMAVARKSKVWIGGMKREGSDGCGDAECWEWSDGSSWDFRNWQFGEPKNLGGNENRVELLPSGRWNDFPGTSKASAVYKCCVGS